MYQNVKDAKFMFYDNILSKSSKFHYLELGVYFSFMEFVEAMTTFIQTKQNHSENCMTVKVSRRTKTIGSYLASEEFCLAFFSTDPKLSSEGNVGIDFETILRGK